LPPRTQSADRTGTCLAMLSLRVRWAPVLTCVNESEGSDLTLWKDHLGPAGAVAP